MQIRGNGVNHFEQKKLPVDHIIPIKWNSIMQSQTREQYKQIKSKAEKTTAERSKQNKSQSRYSNKNTSEPYSTKQNTTQTDKTSSLAGHPCNILT
jgi:hypothetical protein